MKQEKYFSKIDEKIVLKENTTIAITGATGSIGKSIATFFSNREVNLLLIGRNKKKLENLSSSLSNRKAHIETYCLDISSVNEVKKSLPYLKDKNIDIFYNNAGVFRKPIEENEELDVSFKTDYLVPILFVKELYKSNKEMVFINTASISYHYHDFNYDIQGRNIDSRIKRYGFLKRLLIMETNHLREKGIHCYLAHPGISYTGLFSKENSAYPKFVLSLIRLPMKLLFMSPDKASLSLIESSCLHPDSTHEYLGPRGLFHSWGYPGFQKLSNKLFDEKECVYLDEKTDEYIQKYYL